MKKSQLRQIIREEFQRIFIEQDQGQLQQKLFDLQIGKIEDLAKTIYTGIRPESTTFTDFAQLDPATQKKILMQLNNTIRSLVAAENEVKKFRKLVK